MRVAAMKFCRLSGFRSVDEPAEATTFQNASCDLTVAGQAFHWFDVERTRANRRILKPDCYAALIWNERARRTGRDRAKSKK